MFGVLQSQVLRELCESCRWPICDSIALDELDFLHRFEVFYSDNLDFLTAPRFRR
jgi:hypothetical protein